jgi:VWFA-related protein
LRAALNVQQTGAEAAMRLGRLHFIFGRHNEARRMLERAVTEADAAEQPFISYAARLLLASVLEEGRQPALAVEILGQAILSDPTAVSGRVALSQLLLASGRHDEAWTTVRSVFDWGAHPRADPWSVYFAQQYWQHDARLRFMRSLVSSSAPERVRLDPQRTVDRGVSERSHASPEAGQWTAALPVFRATTDAVRIEVMVTDSGRPVRGLTARDFILTDRDQRQVVDRVTRAESVALVILVDASESVSGAAHDAARDAVDSMIRARRGSDTISLLTLSDRLNLLAVRSQDESVLRAAATSIRPQARSKTAMWDALFVGASLVADAAGWPLIVPVSDGGDNASWFSRDEALRRLARVGIQISPVEVPRARIDFDLALGVTALRPLAEATGGSLFAAGDPRFDKSFSEMMSALRESYVLSYRPSEAVRRHGGWHDVKLQLRPGVRGAVRARSGYFAPN